MERKFETRWVVRYSRGPQIGNGSDDLKQTIRPDPVFHVGKKEAVRSTPVTKFLVQSSSISAMSSASSLSSSSVAVITCFLPPLSTSLFV